MIVEQKLSSQLYWNVTFISKLKETKNVRQKKSRSVDVRKANNNQTPKTLKNTCTFFMMNKLLKIINLRRRLKRVYYRYRARSRSLSLSLPLCRSLYWSMLITNCNCVCMFDYASKFHSICLIGSLCVELCSETSKFIP